MMANILDIDLQSMKISLTSEEGVLILFDFEAAFPGISQDYIMYMLDSHWRPSVLHPIGQSLLQQLPLHHEGQWLHI